MITLGKDLVLPKQDRYLTMALRIPWDIEEAVLMLDMLLKSLDGKLTRKEAIRQVSEKLRRRAVNRGIEIDDIFRNENGITFQMSALKVAYTGIKTKLKQPTKLFVETVNLYRNHRELYEEILKEAENVVEPKSVQDEFCSYLSMQMPTFQLSDAYLMLSDIESFCLLHRLDLKGIAISTGSACDSVNTQVSHVIQAIRVPKEYAHGTIRVSFGRDNEESDAVEIAKAIVDILKTK